VADVSFRVVDASSAEAVGAMRAYFAELDERFDGGFEIGSALDDAGASMNPPHGRFLVADRAGRVVGCGGVQRVDESTVEINRMWVDASVRGIGLGKRLLARLEAEAVALGAERVVLDTNRVLIQAISMYTSAGYSPIERYNDNPYAHHWFAKPLTT
jgi:GNAT superfamily N-acetyltransferase